MLQCIQNFVLAIRRFAFFVAANVLFHLLPLPLFPNVSVLLAKSVGIDPLVLNPVNLQLPRFNLSFLLSPFMFKQNEDKPIKKSTAEATISLGEKIRTWRQRNLIEAKGVTPPIDVVPPSKNSRKPIEQVEFEAPIQALTRTVSDSMEALHQVRPSMAEMD